MLVQAFRNVYLATDPSSEQDNGVESNAGIPVSIDLTSFIDNSYVPFCDDFGPMNIGAVIRFIEQLDEAFNQHPLSILLYCVDPDRRSLTNAIFLLGCYMIIVLDQTVDDVANCFEWAEV